MLRVLVSVIGRDGPLIKRQGQESPPPTDVFKGTTKTRALRLERSFHKWASRGLTHVHRHRHPLCLFFRQFLVQNPLANEVHRSQDSSLIPSSFCFVPRITTDQAVAMSTPCRECGGPTVWDDAAASEICTSCGSLADAAQVVLTSQDYYSELGLHHELRVPAPNILKSRSNYTLAGQGQAVRDQKNAVGPQLFF